MKKNEDISKLFIYYFDQVEGPKLFFSKDEYNPFNSVILDMLLSYGSGEKPFPIAFEDFQTLNYRFYISSKFARSGFEEFMITFMVNDQSTENFKSLKLKSQIIKEFAHEIKNIKEIPKILSEKRKSRKGIGDMGYNKFNETLLTTYNKYFQLLTLPFAGKPKEGVISNLKGNIKSEILIYIVHACLFRNNLLVIIKKESKFIIPDLNNFIDYIFQKSFTGHILIKAKSQYKKNKPLYGGYIVMNEKDLVNETRKLVNSNQLIYENELIRTFYNNNNGNSSVLNLKERLEGIYILARYIYNFYERNSNKGPFTPRTVMKHLEESLLVKKIKKQYLYFLTDIIRAYFGLSIVWRWDKLGEKIDELWKV
ncbi:MAG: hypothetical protein ACXAAH_05765 [Promethearchaeota archaeon]|jgi:hypothetical protein